MAPRVFKPIAISISIHALREESDALAQRRDVTASISIHALREEDDGFVPFYR